MNGSLALHKTDSRLCGSVWPRCTMPGIFVDIYFLKATILHYLLQLVCTLNAGALSTHGTLYTLHICKL